jgi:hypothetical protein
MAPDCDADHDGYTSLSTPGCTGNDCDDDDSNVHPGQTAFFTVERASGGFDYDCDGVEERAWSEALDCSLLGGSVLNGCEGQGFSGSVPACGTSGSWIECAPTLPPLSVCQAGDDGTKLQACH